MAAPTDRPPAGPTAEDSESVNITEEFSGFTGSENDSGGSGASGGESTTAQGGPGGHPAGNGAGAKQAAGPDSFESFPKLDLSAFEEAIGGVPFEVLEPAAGPSCPTTKGENTKVIDKPAPGQRVVEPLIAGQAVQLDFNKKDLQSSELVGDDMVMTFKDGGIVVLQGFLSAVGQNPSATPVAFENCNILKFEPAAAPPPKLEPAAGPQPLGNENSGAGFGAFDAGGLGPGIGHAGPLGNEEPAFGLPFEIREPFDFPRGGPPGGGGPAGPGGSGQALVRELALPFGTNAPLPDEMAAGVLGVNFGADGPRVINPVTFQDPTGAGNLIITDSAGNVVPQLFSGTLPVTFRLVNPLQIVGETAPNAADVILINLMDVPPGSFLVTLLKQVNHPDGTMTDLNDVFNLDFDVNIFDADNDMAEGAFVVVVADDAPTVVGVTDFVTEQGLVPNGTQAGMVAFPTVVNGVATINFGADGPRTGIPAVEVNGFTITDPETGAVIDPATLTSGGLNLVYASVGTNLIATTTGGDPVFSFSIGNTGIYGFTLSRQLDHPDLGQIGPDDPIRVTFNISAHDFDGDSTASTVAIDIRDDGPIAAASNVQVEEAALAIGTNPASPNEVAAGVVGIQFGADGPTTTGNPFAWNTTVTVTDPDDGNVVVPLTSGGVPVIFTVSPDGLTLTGMAGATPIVTVQLTNIATGAYTVTLLGPVDHPDVGQTGALDPLLLNLGYTLTDFDGDTATSSANVTILDDAPTALNDMDMVVEGLITTGNVVTGVDTDADPRNVGVLQADTPAGADGFATPGTVTNVQFGATNFAVPAGGASAPIATPFGVLTMNSDGSYSFDATGVAVTGTQQVTFTYTVVDRDGDPATANLVIDIKDDVFRDMDMVEEAALNADGTNPGSPNEVATGTLTYAFANGTPAAVNPFVFSNVITFGEMDGFPNGFVGPITSDGVPVVFTVSANGLTVTGTAGATPVITIQLTNVVTGAYTVTLLEEIDHPDPTQVGANDQIVLNLNYTITDSAGTTNAGIFEVGVKDDGPVFTAGTDMVEEAALADGSTPASPNEAASGLLGYQFGADGPTNNAGELPFVWSPTITFGEMDGFPNGYVGPLTSNGVPVVFTVSPDGLTLTGTAGVTPVIVIQNTNVATGAYTITLLDKVDHPDPTQTGANDQITLNLSYTLLDDDGDTTVGTFVAGIKDDGPTATLATDMVDERDLSVGSNPAGTGETTSGTLPGFTFGADGPTNNAGELPFAWSPTVTFAEMDAFPNGFVGPLTSEGVPVVFTVSPDGLTLTGTAGVTPVITVQITNVATGAYTATLLQPIDHPDPAQTGANDQILLNLQYQLLDDDGDTFTGAFALGVKDDGPIARDDMDMVVEGTITTGNVVTGTDTDVDPRNVGVLQADSANADGFESNPPPGIVTQVTFGATTVAVAPGAPGIINTGNGIMTMNSDGSYSFDATGVTTNGNQLIQFTYTIIDDDGDTSTAMLDLTLKDDVFRDMDMVDERALDASGSLAGDPIIGNNEIATGTLSYIFGNGTPAAVNPFVWNPVVTFGEMDGFPQGYTGPLTADGDTLVFTVSPDGLTLTGSVPITGTGQFAGQDILTVQITNVATGAYTATLLNPVDHPDGGHIGPDDQIVLNLGYTITDSVGTAIQGIFELGVKDDGPQRSPDIDMVDERALDGIGSLAGDPIIGDNEITMGNLTYTFGADTPAAVDPFRWSPTVLFGEMDGFPNGFTGPLTSNGVPVTFAVSPDGLTLTGTAGATPVITIQLTNVLTGAYTVTLQGVVDHPDPTQTGVNDQIALILGYTTTDNDGDTSTGSFVVGVKDDGPTARDDMDMVLENTITTGNVVTAVDTDVDPRNQGMLLADSSGADGFDAGGAIVTQVTFGATTVPVTTGVPGVINTGGFGILTMNADGSYSFDTTGVNVALDQMVQFTYTIQDREGDTDTAVLDLLIKDGNNTNFRDMDMVDERALDGRGSLEFDPVIGNNEVTTGTLSYTFANGTPNAVNPFVFSNVITFGESDAFPNGFAGPITAGGDAVVFTVSPGGQTITGSVPAGTGPFVGQDIVTIQVTNVATGAYTVTLINPIDHPDPTQTGVNDQITLNLSYTVTDSAGTAGNGTFVVGVKDDGPNARDDMDMVVEGQVSTGNVVTGVDTDVDPRNQGMLQADTAGSDGFDVLAPIGIVTQVMFGAATFNVPAGGSSAPIVTPFGTLTMNSDGSYSFDSTGVNVTNNQNASFTYTIVDSEGDSTTAVLDILIKDNLFRDMDMVEEAALNTNGTNPGSPNEVTTGNLNYTYGSDGPTDNPGERPFVWQTPVTFGEMDGFPNGFVGPITADGDLVVFTVSADGQTITGSVPAGAGQYVGQDIITIQVTDFNTGAYVVTLINPIDHPDPTQTGANDQIVLNLNYELLDDDGDTTQGIFEVGIKDDAPFARDDMDMVVENQITTGNVITAVDPDIDPRNVGVLLADDTGSDVATLVTQVQFGAATFNVPAGGSSAPIATPFGILVMNSDGSYTFDATGVAVTGTQQVTFRYTITDDDGDTSAANLVIDIKDDAFRDMDMVDERALDAGGSLANDPVIGNNEITNGNLSYIFANGTPAVVNPFVWSNVVTFGEMDGFPNGFAGPLTADGDTVVFTVSPDGLTLTGSVPLVGTGQYAGQDIITIQLTNPATGAYTVTLINPVDHPDGTQSGPDDQIVLDLDYTITDSAGTQTQGAFEVGIKDDGPNARRDMDMVDERALDGRGSLEFDPVIGGNETATGNLTYSFASGLPAAGTGGFDWLPTVAFGEMDGFPNGFTGPITAGGDAVVFTVSPDGLTVTGSVPVGVGPFAGQDIITIQITDIATGAYAITLINPIDHPDPSRTGVNDQIELVLTYQITDSDGDTASSQFAVGIKDDGPFARDDMDMVAEGEVTTGNLLTGVDTDVNPLNQGMLQADSSGADGFAGAGGFANAVTQVTFGATTVAVAPGVPGVINTGTGILTVNADGSYSFDSTGVNVVGDQNLMFTYTIMDAEGDTSTANLDILVKDNNPPVFDDMDMVDERALNGRGTLEFDPIIGDNEVAMGNLSYVYVNGTPNAVNPFTFTGISFSEMDGFPQGFVGPITADGDTVVFTISADGQTLTGAVPAGTGSFVGQDIITIQLTNAATGAYTVTLINPIDHPDPARAGANDQIELNITYTVTDSGGTTGNGTFDVGIKDDEPIARDDMDMVVEGQITTGNVITAVDTDVDPRNQGMLNADTIGADGEGTVTFIEFSDPAFGAFASQVLPGVPGSVPTPWGTLTMNSDGSYSFDATGFDVDQSQTVTIRYTITDNDGDSSTANLEIEIKDSRFNDMDMVEEAALNANGTNPGSPNEIASGNLTYSFGADGPANDPGERPFVWSPTVTFGEMDGFPNGFVGPLTSDGVPITFVTSADGLTLTGSAGATPIITIQLTDVNTGAYTVTLLGNVDHPDPTQTFANDQVVLELSYTLTDEDGDTGFGKFDVGIKDDAPIARDDMDMVVEGQITTGNVITAVDNDVDPRNQGMQVADSTGADVPALVTQVMFGAATFNVPAGGNSGPIATPFGVLTMNSDGSYSFDASGVDVNAPMDVLFTYTIVDDDGDTSTADLKITIKDSIFRDMDMVDERGLDNGGSLKDDPVIGDDEVTTGNLSYVFPSGTPAAAGAFAWDAGTITFGEMDGFPQGFTGPITSDGDTVVFTASPDGLTLTGSVPITGTGQYAGQDIITVQITDVATGAYTVTLLNPVDHPDPMHSGPDDQIVLNINYTITDDVGQTANGIFEVGVKDDGPNARRDMDMVDERALDGTGSLAGDPIIGDNEVTMGNLTYSFTSGGPAPANAFVWDAMVGFGEVDGFPNGFVGPLTADGDTITFLVSLDGQTVTGIADPGGTGAFAGQDIIRIEVTDILTGAYTVTLVNPVDHPDPTRTGVNDQLELLLTYTITDSDGDQAAGAFAVGIKDDGPVARDDMDMVVEDQITTGNVVTAVDTDVNPLNQGMLLADSSGSDGFDPALGVVTQVTFGAATFNIPAGGNSGPIATPFGVLTMDSNGSYSFDATGVDVAVNQMVMFTYTIQDAEGDTSTANLDILIKDDDNDNFRDMDMVDERGLDGRGSLEFDPVIGDNEVAMGMLSYVFANGTPNAVNPFVFSNVVTFGEMDGFPNGFVGPVTADGDTVVFTVSPDGQTITGSVPLVGTGEFAGQDIITIQITDVLTGAYTVTLLNPIDHPDPAHTGADDQIVLNLTYTVTDSAGTVGNGTFEVGVKDDGPVARDDMDMVVENMITTGNVITAADTDVDPRMQGMLNMDDSGADGFDDTPPIGLVTNVNFNGTDFAVPAGGDSGPINTPFGVLTMNADGSYSFDSTGIDVDQSQTVSFRYTIQDEEGDSSTANLDIEIKDSRFNDMDMVDERGLDGRGSLELDPVIGDDEVTAGNLNYTFGADGPTTDPAENPFQWSAFIGFGEMDGFPNGFAGPLTADGDTVVFTVSPDGLTLTGSVPAGAGQYVGQDIITIQLTDITTGAYVVTLLNPVDHPDPAQSGADDQIVLDLQYRLLDEDGDTAFGTFEVGIKDDAPIARDDMDMVVEGQVTTGNVIDGTDTDVNPMNQGMQVADTEGSDMPALVTQVQFGAATFNVPAGGNSGPIATPFGVLVMNSDGSYTFDASGIDVNAPMDVLFTYTLTDDDGDSSTADLKITVKDQNFMDMDMVDERGLDGIGSLELDPVIGDDEITTGNLSYTFVSGTPAAAGAFAWDAASITFGEMDGFPNGFAGPVTADGDTVVFTVSPDGLTLTGSVPLAGTGEFAGQDIITVQITDVATGAYTVTLLNPVDHPDPAHVGAEDQIVLNINYAVTDDNGATGNGTFEVGVKDDGPTARDDMDMTTKGGMTTGNVITGVDNDPNPIDQGMLEADTEGADGVEIIRSLEHEGVTFTLNAAGDDVDITGVPAGAVNFNPATGELTFDTAAGGTFIIDMAGPNVGDYKYNAPAPGGGGAPVVLDLTDPGVTGTPGVTISAFDIDNSAGTLSFGANGMGVVNDPGANPGDFGNDQVPDQLNRAPDFGPGGSSERIEIELADGAESFSFAYNRAIQGESGGEVGQWTAFDAGGNQIGQGLFGNPFTPTAGAGVGSVDITSADLGGMVAAKVVFVALPYFNGDQGNNDSSDYFLTEFTGHPPGACPPNEMFTYTIEDEDGDQSTAKLTIKLKDDNRPNGGDDMDMVDERGLDGIGSGEFDPILGDNEFTSGNLSYDFGPDGPSGVDPFVWSTAITFGEMDGFPNGFAGPIMSDGDTLEYRLEDGGLTLIGFVPNTGTGEFAGDDIIRIELTDVNTGAYEVTLLNPVDHPDPNHTGAEDQIVLNLEYTITDGTGDEAIGSFEVGIKDDGPWAEDDIDMTTKGGTTTGNVVTGVDNDPDPINQGMQEEDIPGADGAEFLREISHEGVTFTLNATNDDVDVTMGTPAGPFNFNPATGELTFETAAGGSFTIDMTGSNLGDYSYTAPGGGGGGGVMYSFDSDDFGFPGPWTNQTEHTFNAGGDPADDITVRAVDQDGNGPDATLTSFNSGGARGLGIKSNNTGTDKAFRREAFEIEFATPAEEVVLEIADMPASDSRQLRWTAIGKDANGDDVEFQGNFEGMGVGQEAVAFTIDQNELNTTEVQPGSFTGPVTISQIILDSPSGAVAGFGDIFNETSFVLNSVKTTTPGDHDCPPNEMFTYVLEDGDGDTESAKLTIEIKDDPDNGDPKGGHVCEMINEKHLDDGSSPNPGQTMRTGSLEYDFGPDGPAGSGAFVWSNMVTVTDSDDGNPQPFSGTATVGGVPVTYDVSGDGLTINGMAGGTLVFTMEVTDLATGQYKYTQFEAIDHPDGATPGNPEGGSGTDDTLVFDFTYEIKDADGETAEGHFQMIVKDDSPYADDDWDMVREGRGPTTGNVVTGEDNDVDPDNQGMQVEDVEGADGATVTRVEHDGNDYDIPAGGSVTFTTDLGGEMTFNDDGSYSYTPPADIGGRGSKFEEFDYTLTDTDGDASVATLDIEIKQDPGGDPYCPPTHGGSGSGGSGYAWGSGSGSGGSGYAWGSGSGSGGSYRASGSGSGSGNRYNSSGSGSGSGDRYNSSGSGSGSGDRYNSSGSGSGSGDRYNGSGSGSGDWRNASGSGSGSAERYDIAARGGSGSGYGSGYMGSGGSGGSWSSGDYLRGGRGDDGDLYRDHMVASSKFAGHTFENGYTVFGRGAAAHGRIAMATLAAAAGIVLDGSMNGGAYAAHIVDAGDVNGDGFKDIIVAKGNLESGAEVDGKAWLVFGNDDADPRTVNLDDITRGENGYDWDKGEAIDHATPAHLMGDVDNDGAVDIVAATGTDGAYGVEYQVAGKGTDFVSTEGSGHVVFGEAGDDILIGTAGNDDIDGGDGNDILIGNGGFDGFDGGAGDDVIAIRSADFDYVDGGTGLDVLRLDGMFDLDLGAISDRTENIETIDLTGHGDNEVTLDVSDVLDITEVSNNLTIVGDSGDSVTADFSGYEVASRDMGDFTVYVIDNGLAELSISNDLNQNIITDMA